MSETAVARVCHFLAGSSFGGGTYVVWKVCEGLQAAGHEPFVIASDEATVRFFQTRGIETIDTVCVQRAIQPARDLAAAVKLARILRTVGCDLLHTHTSKGGVVGRIAGTLARIPRIVHHVHGFAFDPIFTPRPLLLLYSTIERAVTPLCDAVIFVNPTDLALAKAFRILRPGQKSAVVLNGVDIPSKTASDGVAPRQNAGGNVLRVGFVGRLAPQKGVDILISAAAGLMRSVPFECLIIGDGPERQNLEHQAEGTGLRHCFQFLGHREDVAGLIQTLDIVVLPSRWEGHSISLLECLGAGKPVVTTRIKGNVETVIDGKNGLLVRPGDPDQLSSALDRLIREPQLRCALAEGATRTVEERFSAARMLTGVFAVYRRLGLQI
ncbi:MAG: glycosyltransferase family 4 protein [Bryobacteraceae bacterium]|nr:glycosyltransferase family 4 protein [Bryobacteraceae bacterium]